MPPRHAYWTILVDEQPTAFRSAMQEDLQPTFKRLKEKHASARMVWFQNGKIWDSRLDAQEAMRARGEMGRRGDVKQGGGFRERNRSTRTVQPTDRRDDSGKLEWRPKDPKAAAEGRESPPRAKREGGLDWQPKGGGQPRERQAQFHKPDWKPKGDWKPKSVRPERRPPFKARQSARSESTKLDWKPKGETAAPKRKWIPKEEFKRAQAPGPKTQARRDKTWRPGGEHKDPRQKYKDAKKAKWTRFKQTVRKRWESKQGKKRKDDE